MIREFKQGPCCETKAAAMKWAGEQSGWKLSTCKDVFGIWIATVYQWVSADAWYAARPKLAAMRGAA